MKTIVWAMGMALALATPAVRAQTTTGGTIECPPHVSRCVVPVYVQPEPNAPDKCRAKVAADRIVVPRPNALYVEAGQPIRVVWVLEKGHPAVDLNDYAFQADGIRAKANQPNDQFQSEGVESGSPRHFVWASKHPDRGRNVRYTITVARRNGARCIEDPTITNRKN
jgi:hypothetical protein